MDFFVYVESNIFKVKNAEKFKLDFESRVMGDEVTLNVQESGFQIWAANPRIINPDADMVNDPDNCECSLEIADVIQPHLKKGQIATLKYINSSSRNSYLGGAVCVVTDLAIQWEDMDHTINKLVASLYPRRVKCTTSCYNKKEDTWIEEGKTYIAVCLQKIRSRWYYTINQKGQLTTWSEEYFNGGEEGKSV